MFKTIKTAALSVMIGLGAISTLPVTANAGDLSIHIGGGHYRNGGFGLFFGDSGHSYRRDHGRYERFCSPRRAVNKARRMGVRHARVAHVNHRTIGVKGRRHGHRSYIVFARAPHCPVLR